ncbi:putative acetate--CoA ligase [Helianthus annuus]|nr:putative acetate--CoA ligase [Helianthus annuus]
MLMELPISMLACARIGAVHSVVFAGFSAESLEQRIIDCKPKIVITCNAVKRGTKSSILRILLILHSRNHLKTESMLVMFDLCK